MCLRPSCSTTSTIARPPESARRGSGRRATGPSSSSTPSRSRRPTSRADRAGHLGEVGLGHPERRVHQPVRELAVVGQQQQPLAVGVQPADVEQPLGPVGDQVADGRAGRGRRTSPTARRAACSARGRPGPSRTVTRSPSTWTTAVSGSTRMPMLAHPAPSTLTRPAAISSSQARAASRRRRRPAPSAAGCRRGWTSEPRPRRRELVQLESDGSGSSGASDGSSSRSCSPIRSRNSSVVRNRPAAGLRARCRPRRSARAPAGCARRRRR